MTTKQLERLAGRWWNIGIAEMNRLKPGSSSALWSKANEANRAGWLAVVRHALKTVNRKRK